MPSGTKRKTLFIASAIATLALGANAFAVEKITFQLNYPAAGYNAGYELAVQKGFYKDVGLDVTIEPGNGSQITAQLVAARRDDKSQGVIFIGPSIPKKSSGSSDLGRGRGKGAPKEGYTGPAWKGGPSPGDNGGRVGPAARPGRARPRQRRT